MQERSETIVLFATSMFIGQTAVHFLHEMHVEGVRFILKTLNMFDKQFKIADGVRSLNMFYPNLNLGFVVLSNVNDKSVFSQVIDQIEAWLI